MPSPPTATTPTAAAGGSTPRRLSMPMLALSRTLSADNAVLPRYERRAEVMDPSLEHADDTSVHHDNLDSDNASQCAGNNSRRHSHHWRGHSDGLRRRESGTIELSPEMQRHSRRDWRRRRSMSPDYWTRVMQAGWAGAHRGANELRAELDADVAGGYDSEHEDSVDAIGRHRDSDDDDDGNDDDDDESLDGGSKRGRSVAGSRSHRSDAGRRSSRGPWQPAPVKSPRASAFSPRPSSHGSPALPPMGSGRSGRHPSLTAFQTVGFRGEPNTSSLTILNSDSPRSGHRMSPATSVREGSRSRGNSPTRAFISPTGRIRGPGSKPTSRRTSLNLDDEDEVMSPTTDDDDLSSPSPPLAPSTHHTLKREASAMDAQFDRDADEAERRSILDNAYMRRHLRHGRAAKHLRGFRRGMYVFLEVVETIPAKLYSVFYFLLVVLSVVLVCVESQPQNHILQPLSLRITDSFLCIVFTGDLLARIFAAPSRLHYVRQPMTILDALSLIPYWLDMFSATAPYSSSSALAILRTLRIGRVFQAFRYLRESPLIAITVRAVRRSRDAFMLIGMYAALSVLVASSAMFVAERGVFDEARGVWVMDGEVSSFQSIPSGFYWAAITVTTTGYGDVTPRTVWGKIVAGLTAIVGVSIIALPVSIVGSNFMAEWIDYQRHRLKAKIHTDRLLGVLPSDIPPTPGIPAPRLSKRAQLSRLLEQNDAMMQLVSQAQEALNDINPSDAYVRYKRVKEKYSVAVLRIRELQAELAVLRLNNERNAASSTPTGGNGNNDGGSDRGGGGFGQGGGRGGGGGDRRRGPRRIESALSVLPFTRSFTLPSTRAPPMDAYDQQQQSQTIRGGLGPVRTLTPVVDVSGASSSEPGSPLRPVHAAAAIAAPVALSHPAPIARRRAPSLKLAGRGTPVPSPMPSPNAHVAQAHADAPMRGATPPLISLVGSILRPASAASSVHSQRRGTPSRALSPFEGSSGSAATSATATPADLQSMMYGRPLMALARVKSTPDAVALALGEINAEGEDVTKVSRPRAMSMGIIRPLSNLFSRHGSPKSRPRRSMEKNNHRHHRDETVVGMPAPSSHLRIPMSTLSMPDNSVPLSDRSTTSSITSPVPSSYMSSSIAVGDLRSQQQLPPPLFGGAAVPSRTRIVTASTEMPISPHVILFGNGGGTGLLQSPVENSRPVSLMHPSSADDASDHGIVVGGRLSSPTLAHHPPPESH